jgi:hypothetical protein
MCHDSAVDILMFPGYLVADGQKDSSKSMKECSDGKEDYVLEGDVIVAILQN